MIDTRLLERRIELREAEIQALEDRLTSTAEARHKARKAIIARLMPLIHDQIAAISLIGEIKSTA